MIVATEYIFPNPKIKELDDIIENTRREHHQKSGEKLY